MTKEEREKILAGWKYETVIDKEDPTFALVSMRVPIELDRECCLIGDEASIRALGFSARLVAACLEASSLPETARIVNVVVEAIAARHEAEG